MAIDTRDKRAAGVGFGLPFGAILPAPDGSVGGLSDRQIVSFGYPIIAAISVFIEPHRYLYWSGTQVTESDMGYMGLVDGVSEPDAVSGYTVVYVDSSDGALKAKDGDGNVTELGESTTVKVSANDTTAGYLNGKLVAGSNISLTEDSDGGDETLTIAITGVLPSANGGTGIDNGGRTLTIATNSGTLAFGAAASTLTIPATGTAALLATTNVFTATQTVGDGSTFAVIALNGAAGFVRRLVLRTNGADRWRIEANSTAEGGSDAGSDLDITARTDAGGGIQAVRVVRSSGDVLVGTTTDSAKLAVDQSSTTAAKPVLFLDQGDVDQDLIEFVGGSSTGNVTTISTDAVGVYAGRIQITVNGTRRWIPFYADA